jgi:hypothetical protein
MGALVMINARVGDENSGQGFVDRKPKNLTVGLAQ